MGCENLSCAKVSSQSISGLTASLFDLAANGERYFMRNGNPSTLPLSSSIYSGAARVEAWFDVI